MPRTRKDWTQDEETKLLYLWGEGKTYKEMGEALGRTPKSVQQHVYYMQSHRKGIAKCPGSGALPGLKSKLPASYWKVKNWFALISAAPDAPRK